MHRRLAASQSTNILDYGLKHFFSDFDILAMGKRGVLLQEVKNSRLEVNYLLFLPRLCCLGLDKNDRSFMITFTVIKDVLSFLSGGNIDIIDENRYSIYSRIVALVD